MTINIFDSSTHKSLVNGRLRNGWINRLTVFFDDGDAVIEEIHEASVNCISELEFNGHACHIDLPEVIFEVDIESVAQVLKPVVDSQDWGHVQRILDNLSEHVHFCWEYTDGYYEACETDEAMAQHITKHGKNVAAIVDEILRGGWNYAWLTEWVEHYVNEYE